MNTGFFHSFDHAELFYREWNFKPGQKTIIIMHRGHEHSGRLEEFATDARFADYNIFSYDQRGLGYTKQPVSPVFMDYVRDLDAFATFLHQQYNVRQEDVFLVANSIAGVIVTSWVHDFAPRIAGMILLAPAFEIKLYVPFAKQFVTMGTWFNKNMSVPSYVKAKVLTHDEAQQKAYNSDKLITHSINARMLLDMLKHGLRIVDDAAAISTPTCMLISGKDYVVKEHSQKKFYLSLSSETKEFIVLKDFYHGLLFEVNRTVVYDHIARFAAKCFAMAQPVENLEPDTFSRNEYDRLSLRMIPWYERANFAIQKVALGKIGSLSRGMALGNRYGFDSGISLDYVYRNHPQGRLGIGRLMDSAYLNAIGWRGIRIRKQNLLQLIEQQIAVLEKDGKPIKILDIAGGTGNYLFDIKAKHPAAEIVINEFKTSNIEVGQKHIDELHLTNIRFTNYDCFDSATYPKLNFKPNIVIISGIFELFDDNALISNAISGATSILDSYGVVIYTGQPWHPQLKQIAYVLKSMRERDWVMRRRSQSELDRVFAYNGVQKQSMLIDNYGIFTVSCGVKSSAV